MKLPEIVGGLSSSGDVTITDNDVPLARLSAPRPRAFACRVAAFSAIGFCVTTAGITYLDASLVNSHHGARHYPLGYSVCWLSIVLFFAVYYLIVLPRGKLLRLFLPPVAGLVCTALVLPNFAPVPHGAVCFWMVLYAIAALTTLWVRLHPDVEKDFNNHHIDPQAKVEWIKASFDIWRSLFTGSLIAYMALVVTWVSTNSTLNAYVTRDKAELERMAGLNMAGVAVYSAFVVGGPLYELYYKMRNTAALLLTVKRELPGAAAD